MMSKDPSKREIGLNDLTRYSPWPARLLGLEKWNIPTRDIGRIGQEYDIDHYARCLRYFLETTPKPPPSDLRRFQYEIEGLPSLSSTVCLSKKNRLYLARLSSALKDIDQIVTRTMSTAIAKASTVIELGCGYGYFLWLLSRKFPNKAWRGGEYSTNAVRLAGELFDVGTNIQVVRMNLYDPNTYKFIEKCVSPIVIFTVRSIEQLPVSEHVFDALGEYSEKIEDVFHFEPVYELYGTSLLGLMRRRYTQLNDYNKDLLTQIKTRSTVRLRSVKDDVIGIPPLNPMSIIHWQFAK
jgi:hypothetical protein